MRSFFRWYTTHPPVLIILISVLSIFKSWTAMSTVMYIINLLCTNCLQTCMLVFPCHSIAPYSCVLPMQEEAGWLGFWAVTVGCLAAVVIGRWDSDKCETFTSCFNQMFATTTLRVYMIQMGGLSEEISRKGHQWGAVETITKVTGLRIDKWPTSPPQKRTERKNKNSSCSQCYAVFRMSHICLFICSMSLEPHHHSRTSVLVTLILASPEEVTTCHHRRSQVNRTRLVLTW